jgi:damage-control phosphatase, subfamily I
MGTIVGYAVRGGRVLNDSTLEDADYTGITKIIKVIDNGSDIPGVLLDHCSE